MKEECANYMSATVGVCPRQWEHVCNSGWVLFGSESYQNDRFNSCYSMNILSIKYSYEFHSFNCNIFGSSSIQHAFIHKQSRFVRDSGSMSATVGGCSL